MKLSVYSLTNEELKKRDYSNAFMLKINGKTVLSVADGEPEDNNLSRNFSDILSIPRLLQQVYDAGTLHDGFEIEFIETDEF